MIIKKEGGDTIKEDRNDYEDGIERRVKEIRKRGVVQNGRIEWEKVERRRSAAL